MDAFEAGPKTRAAVLVEALERGVRPAEALDLAKSWYEWIIDPPKVAKCAAVRDGLGLDPVHATIQELHDEWEANKNSCGGVEGHTGPNVTDDQPSELSGQGDLSRFCQKLAGIEPGPQEHLSEIALYPHKPECEPFVSHPVVVRDGIAVCADCGAIAPPRFQSADPAPPPATAADPVTEEDEKPDAPISASKWAAKLVEKVKPEPPRSAADGRNQRTAPPPIPTRQRILTLLQGRGSVGLSHVEIAQFLGITTGNASVTLNDLKKAGLAHNPKKGTWVHGPAPAFAPETTVAKPVFVKPASEPAIESPERIDTPSRDLTQPILEHLRLRGKLGDTEFAIGRGINAPTVDVSAALIALGSRVRGQSLGLNKQWYLAAFAPPLTPLPAKAVPASSAKSVVPPINRTLLKCKCSRQFRPERPGQIKCNICLDKFASATSDGQIEDGAS